MMNPIKYSLRILGIGLFCLVLAFVSPMATAAFQYLFAQVATYTTLAQLPAVSCGGCLNFLSDSANMAFNADSAGTRKWFLQPAITQPIVTANWTTLGTESGTATRTNGADYIDIITPSTATNLIFGVSRTVSAGDFSYILQVYTRGLKSGSNPAILVGFLDTAGQKTEGCGVQGDASVSQILEATALSNTAISGGTKANANGITTGVAFDGLPTSPMIVQLTRVGAVYTCAYSYNNGKSFVTVFSDTTPFLTATSIAAYGLTSSVTSSYGFTLVSSTLQ